MTRLVDLAKVLRSKNSVPFELTMDILMPDEASYRRVMESGVLTKENIAKLYRIPIENIRTLAHMDAACGVKITILRTTPSGTVGDRDVYGAQQAAPLMDLMIP